MNPDMMMKSEESGGSLIDQVISRVESYIQNPRMVTPETLNELKSELIDLKTEYEGESPEDGYNDSTDRPVGGLGGMMKKGEEYA